jgi:SAM-dependent methyltransferase
MAGKVARPSDNLAQSTVSELRVTAPSRAREHPLPPCPICELDSTRSFARFGESDFRACSRCGLVFGCGVNRWARDRLSRDAVVRALQPMRIRNFDRILDDVAQRIPPGGRLLEVGSSTGVFLDFARRRGLDAYGVEPDPYFVKHARERFPELGDRILEGYFPAVHPPGPFQAVCFNDVFEHIPDALSVLDACRGLLTPGGVISMSLPSADGFFFAVARGLFRLGYRFPLARMLQLDFPFPHLYYFGPRSLNALARSRGLTLARMAPLEILGADSIPDRVAMDVTSAWQRRIRTMSGYGLFAVWRLLPRRMTPPDLLHVVLVT